ncbi:C-type lectin domain family 4 member D-like [Haliotis cracherodii]|uniref:C-type lectin domain family 4 member D-like n=1 Tax=Haliotis cracherodii TaxID=6455 RepID=UPI0039EC0E2E
MDSSMKLVVVLVVLLHQTSAVVRRDDSLRCLECHGAKSPLACNQWAICGQGEICYTREYTDSNGEREFHMGCEDKTRCDLYLNAQSVLGILGRREVDDLDLDNEPSPPSPCYQCCSESDCNNRLCLDSLGTQPGAGNSGTGSQTCPPTFISGPHSCYYIASWSLTWTKAREDCQRRGADLVSVNSQQEQAFIVTQLTLINSTSYPSNGYWTGGYYVMALAEWHWVDLTTTSSFTTWGPGQPTSPSYPYSYRIVMVNPIKYPTFSGWAWENLSSSTAMGFICERSFI